MVPITRAQKKQRQEDCRLKANLVYIVRHYLKKKNKKTRITKKKNNRTYCQQNYT